MLVSDQLTLFYLFSTIEKFSLFIQVIIFTYSLIQESGQTASEPDEQELGVLQSFTVNIFKYIHILDSF